ncbi:hypothetical protein GUITHDRAFT_99847 [Guillardia theta CCMP2712]|uniref:Uncharacterized protein n=1 Tax=Guillardia theta (strain CCMP2712) TaxID=905079 RepID=L1K1P4_GUITC|nr:hypothetical protein GUITHDRAFT_99847 [Guillardia theta CCMP2712]EKX54365.1 hypothetical protein GUITHDRAFT_99847 [Guillardia theta CCMP2712]|mmetsp:Transcript_14296/g.48896  ORF Transcript_14296/g.48896 Transcript_14296/m.48896 type:complete len:412 (-) Transcript_14296:1570-2805(-)|eukprot:XP_005841345.1 hypothetical protein GUITHDRAFT_99847 [Guillardia theta CCMP2712]
MSSAGHSRRKAGNPNNAPDVVQEKQKLKAEKKDQKKRDERIKQLSWKYGLSTAGVVITIACIYSLVTISRSSVRTIELNNADLLKEVFFGGDPWMVHCANENTTGLSAGFLGAAKRLSVTSSIKFGAIDCGGKLPSNKTFYERFKLPLYDFNKNRPLGFLFANGDSPLQIPDDLYSEPKKLSNWAEKNSKPSVKEVAWDRTFQKFCILRDACVMLHTKGKYKAPAWLVKVMTRHRATKFVSINRKMHKTSFDGQVRLSRAEDKPRLAIMQRSKDGEDFKYRVTQYRGEWNEKDVEKFVHDLVVKGASHKDTVPLEGKPWFDAPPKGQKGKANARQGGQANERRQRVRREQASREESEQTRSSRTSSANPEDKDAEDEERRMEAVKRAEQQLSEEDEFVVSDIEDEEDSGIV